MIKEKRKKKRLKKNNFGKVFYNNWETILQMISQNALNGPEI
jgi:hypothetical protein